MRYLFNIENLVLPRVAGSSKGQSKIPPGGGQSSTALSVKIVSCFGHLVLEFDILQCSTVNSDFEYSLVPAMKRAVVKEKLRRYSPWFQMKWAHSFSHLIFR